MDFITLDDYTIKIRDTLNEAKIPIKYIIMFNVFLQNLLALILNNFDEQNEIVNILSIFIRGLSLGS